MDLQTLTSFFMWCTIIDIALLLVTAGVLALTADFVYRMHAKWYGISRDAFNVSCYAFLALFKIVIIVINVVPWIALLIIGR